MAIKIRIRRDKGGKLVLERMIFSRTKGYWGMKFQFKKLKCVRDERLSGKRSRMFFAEQWRSQEGAQQAPPIF